MEHRYFRRLQRRYTPSTQAQGQEQRPEPAERVEASSSKEEQNGAACSESAEQPASLKTPVTCINLLRCNMQVSTLCTGLPSSDLCWYILVTPRARKKCTLLMRLTGAWKPRHKSKPCKDRLRFAHARPEASILSGAEEGRAAAVGALLGGRALGAQAAAGPAAAGHQL